jgi:hypothetical protein
MSLIEHPFVQMVYCSIVESLANAILCDDINIDWAHGSSVAER